MSPQPVWGLNLAVKRRMAKRPPFSTLPLPPSETFCDMVARYNITWLYLTLFGAYDWHQVDTGAFQLEGPRWDLRLLPPNDTAGFLSSGELAFTRITHPDEGREPEHSGAPRAQVRLARFADNRSGSSGKSY